ncbi:hypothetical protein PVAP13_1KG246705 [Panicum virgatum]|uniref:Uncharacterized protein n=1 Tax=Panicum virgatum TaxID=38727 RepID=A0A8T0X9R5_PANVG|nr:hypothetical protein PVAP13_1KG246705 [Panicum virgatum]
MGLLLGSQLQVHKMGGSSGPRPISRVHRLPPQRHRQPKVEICNTPAPDDDPNKEVPICTDRVCCCPCHI